MNDKVIVITGASSGIGAALARVVAKKGAKPVLAARREKELSAVAAETNGLAVVADVTRRAEVQRILEQALARHGRVDVWVNNAGRGISRSVMELTDQDLDEMMTVNVKSALYGMQLAAAHFKARKSGHLINVSSMLGRIPFVAIRSAYSASKHFLNSLTANLRMELAGSGVQVSLVSPGVVQTDFGLKALHGGADSRALPFSQTADEVAQVIAEVIEKPRADVYTREGQRQQVAAYYSAEDLGAYEQQLMQRR
jgi:NADP-dependent 3-hydroxy acid dehydrogenase YdfG